MSASALQSTYPTQHCGCDFCSSRRSVNAKKLAVSQRAAQQRDGCTCQCHTKGGSQHGGAAAFNPDYPAPVNQTALNASRGRNGVSGGNQYTVNHRSTRSGAGGSVGSGGDASGKESPEQRQAREMAELDALERLLIGEYKARTRATLEAERLRGATAGGPARRPQPLPEGYAGDSGLAGDGDDDGVPGSWERSGPAGSGSYGRHAATIHEAYAMAQECPVTPPAQCHASHRLQDTLDDVQRVTRDPVNKSNRHALQRVLQRNGLAEATADDSGVAQGDQASKGGENAFGSSLAQIRTSNIHPRGAGVVWATNAAAPQRTAADADVLVVDKAASAGGAGKRTPPPLSPGATATGVAAPRSPAGRHVTYAA